MREEHPLLLAGIIAPLVFEHLVICVSGHPLIHEIEIDPIRAFVLLEKSGAP